MLLMVGTNSSLGPTTPTTVYTLEPNSISLPIGFTPLNRLFAAVLSISATLRNSV